MGWIKALWNDEIEHGENPLPPPAPRPTFPKNKNKNKYCLECGKKIKKQGENK